MYQIEEEGREWERWNCAQTLSILWRTFRLSICIEQRFNWIEYYHSKSTRTRSFYSHPISGSRHFVVIWIVSFPSLPSLSSLNLPFQCAGSLCHFQWIYFSLMLCSLQLRTHPGWSFPSVSLFLICLSRSTFGYTQSIWACMYICTNNNFFFVDTFTFKCWKTTLSDTNRVRWVHSVGKAIVGTTRSRVLTFIQLDGHRHGLVHLQIELAFPFNSASYLSHLVGWICAYFDNSILPFRFRFDSILLLVATVVDANGSVA